MAHQAINIVDPMNLPSAVSGTMRYCPIYSEGKLPEPTFLYKIL